MPTIDENIQFLHLVLTNDGKPAVNYSAVAAALNIRVSTVVKRLSRLNQSMDNDNAPRKSAYQFLWLCIKHTTGVQPINWVEIAAKCEHMVEQYRQVGMELDNGVEALGSPDAPVTSTASGNDTEDEDKPKAEAEHTVTEDIAAENSEEFEFPDAQEYLTNDEDIEAYYSYHKRTLN
ncbi:hypothetical protein TUN199_05444 [Pyrenophora tritici-repentis]|nr:hypothetical protein TUN205_06100 [Pyrenophora tritici-repentis]KAI0622556.1 hypothetical protein TUN199_05444 [Pyrenophora tritici-repentis]